MSTGKVVELPAIDALWDEASDLAEEIFDLFNNADIPVPEVNQGFSYTWTRASYADVRRAMQLLLEAQTLLEGVQERERERLNAFDERLRALEIEP